MAVAVPIDEIQRPIIELRNQSLFYLIAVVVFVLPLCATLIVAWIDRRLGRGRPPSRAIEDECRVVSKSVHFRSPYPIRLPLLDAGSDLNRRSLGVVPRAGRGRP